MKNRPRRTRPSDRIQFRHRRLECFSVSKFGFRDAFRDANVTPRPRRPREAHSQGQLLAVQHGREPVLDFLCLFLERKVVGAGFYVGQNNTEGIGLAEMRRQKLAALNWKDRHRLMLRPPGEADPWSAIPGPRPPRSHLRMCAAAARLTQELRGRGLTPLEQEFQCKLNVPLGPR